MLPLVSIVTPSFNQGQFLRRTLESVASQDYPRIEHLVFDGGSTDDSVRILRGFAEDRSRDGTTFAWTSQADRGQSDAINQGMRRARGDILAYLNSDDILLPGAIAQAVASLQRHSEWDLVYGDAYHIAEDDRILEPYPTAPFDFERLLQSCFICQPATFWRRRVMEKVGLFDESLHYAMDYEYWLRLAQAGGTLAHVAIPLAGSRVHAGTKTLSARMEVYREILEVSRRHAEDASFSQYYAYWHHRCHERATGWPRWMRWLPECHWWLANLHRRLHRARARFPFSGRRPNVLASTHV